MAKEAGTITLKNKLAPNLRNGGVLKNPVIGIDLGPLTQWFDSQIQGDVLCIQKKHKRLRVTQ